MHISEGIFHFLFPCQACYASSTFLASGCLRMHPACLTAGSVLMQAYIAAGFGVFLQLRPCMLIGAQMRDVHESHRPQTVKSPNDTALGNHTRDIPRPFPGQVKFQLKAARGGPDVWDETYASKDPKETTEHKT